MTPKATAFGKFISSMEKETGKTGDELRAILKGAGHKNFQLEKTHLYRSAIAASMMNEEIAKTKAFKVSEPCPIQKCTGYKDRSNRYWPWVCTVGGLKHFLAEGISHWRWCNTEANELLRKVEAIEEEKERQDEGNTSDPCARQDGATVPSVAETS